MDICVTCKEPLILKIDSSEDGDEEIEADASQKTVRTVPDSVELTCGCKFHWECLLDAYSMNDCPNCGSNVTNTSMTGTQQVLCNLDNEGGLQEGLNIMPLLVEAAYLKTYPEERKCRAFLEFAAEGDAISMVELLKSNEAEESEQPAISNDDILRYQDPIGDMGSALHTAVANDSHIAAWLILWLSSSLDSSLFPKEILDTAIELEISRPNMTNKIDIRSLRDGNGITAEERAAQAGSLWSTWIINGWLKA